MVVARVCNEEGCPVGGEVFPGNTQDAGAVPRKIADIRQQYGVKDIIVVRLGRDPVGDCGMITRASAAQAQGLEGLNLISALTHRQIVELLERKGIAPELFDERRIVEVIDPQFKMGQFVTGEVKDNRLRWQFNPERMAAELLLDGCYVICADVKSEAMSSEELVRSYKKLRFVETALRNLKTARLELRPVFHKTDDRIRAHIFLCVLAYYLQWHRKQRLQPLFDSDGEGKHRQ